MRVWTTAMLVRTLFKRVCCSAACVCGFVHEDLPFAWFLCVGVDT